MHGGGDFLEVAGRKRNDRRTSTAQGRAVRPGGQRRLDGRMQCRKDPATRRLVDAVIHRIAQETPILVRERCHKQRGPPEIEHRIADRKISRDDPPRGLRGDCLIRQAYNCPQVRLDR